MEERFIVLQEMMKQERREGREEGIAIGKIQGKAEGKNLYNVCLYLVFIFFIWMRMTEAIRSIIRGRSLICAISGMNYLLF